jgi:hypothetical protein
MPNYQEPGLSDLKLKISSLELEIHELMMRIENLEKKCNGTDSSS